MSTVWSEPAPDQRPERSACPLPPASRPRGSRVITDARRARAARRAADTARGAAAPDSQAAHLGGARPPPERAAPLLFQVDPALPGALSQLRQRGARARLRLPEHARLRLVVARRQAARGARGRQQCAIARARQHTYRTQRPPGTGSLARPVGAHSCEMAAPARSDVDDVAREGDAHAVRGRGPAALAAGDERVERVGRARARRGRRARGARCH